MKKKTVSLNLIKFRIFPTEKLEERHSRKKSLSEFSQLEKSNTQLEYEFVFWM